MMKTKNLLLLAALTTGASLGSLALAPSAQAIATYTLNNVLLNGGGTITGTFDYDSSPGPNGTYSNINLTVSGTPGNQANWTTVGLTQNVGFTVSGATSAGFIVSNQITTVTTSDINYRGIDLSFIPPLTGNSSDAPTINTSNSPPLFPSGVLYGTGSSSSSFNVASGSLTATPVPLESDALPIVGAAAFMAGGLWWKRRRAQAKANLDFLGVASEK